MRALSHALYGGADFGECFVTASQIAPGDADSWCRAWTATADRVAAIAEAWLRASNYYRTAWLPLVGAPVDPRLVEAVEIPYEGTSLPGYFHRADDSGRPRPLLIATNGYDATVDEAHLVHAVAAVRRGYHCPTFDGPGQGRPLIHQGLVFRPDWEAVVRPVVDYALSRPDVDPQRIALIGWSFGGYLAPRAASGEHRLAACIADPGQWDLLEALRLLLPLPPAVRERLPEIAPADLEAVEAQMRSSPSLQWTVRRALWVHGLDSFADYIRIAGKYSLRGRAERIRCPTLVAWAEGDPIARFAEQLHDALQCPRTLVRFTTAEGAGGHCEETARSLFHQRAYDWLETVFASPGAAHPCR
ncbi:alpha/beta fold hydrolase [Synechococcus sp. CS-1324]|uniref:alpha/beta hydrolase family protein n=1 Tax=Synechococcus sp. CS-1324 TaxID=2847980 RepID=UPI000DB6B2DA|nr:alpha/beta fold hydrolase [Synechococcus sp. CS-1324]MCT0230168.1 alpha/beta fold hydrolase [Synechococcus sp. CS-1324]PZV01059.1 MAG: alpha/beta hydrolase [Cyanobium sp.]